MRSFSSVVCRLVVFSLFVGIAGHFAVAQETGTDLADVSHKNEYEKQRYRFTTLRDKGNQPLTKDDLALMDLAAKFYIYRVTSLQAKGDSKQMHLVVKAFEDEMQVAMAAMKNNPPLNLEFIKAFTKAAVT